LRIQKLTTDKTDWTDQGGLFYLEIAFIDQANAPERDNIPQGLKPAVVAAFDAKAEALAYLEAKTPML
jgi:hypothetical protein